MAKDTFRLDEVLEKNIDSDYGIMSSKFVLLSGKLSIAYFEAFAGDS